jgi:tRNA-specific 2-thiouridylase
MKITAKMRSTQLPVAGVVRADSSGGAVVELTEPEFGIAPGQACVLYDGDRVLGGGWIARDQAA